MGVYLKMPKKRDMIVKIKTMSCVSKINSVQKDMIELSTIQSEKDHRCVYLKLPK